jgi:hypothetical protein
MVLLQGIGKDVGQAPWGPAEDIGLQVRSPRRVHGLGNPQGLRFQQGGPLTGPFARADVTDAPAALTAGRETLRLAPGLP